MSDVVPILSARVDELYPPELRTPFRELMKKRLLRAAGSEEGWKRGKIMVHLIAQDHTALCGASRPRGGTFDFTPYAVASQCCKRCLRKVYPRGFIPDDADWSSELVSR